MQEEGKPALQEAQQSSRNKGYVGVALLLVVLLALANAFSSDGRSNPLSTGSNQSEAPAREDGLEADDAARGYADAGKQSEWIELSKEAVRQRLRDPESAKFRNVRFYSGGVTAVACGEVNGKNAFGAYEGYERFVAAGPLPKLATLETDMATTHDMNMVWREMCVKAPTDEV